MRKLSLAVGIMIESTKAMHWCVRIGQEDALQHVYTRYWHRQMVQFRQSFGFIEQQSGPDVFVHFAQINNSGGY